MLAARANLLGYFLQKPGDVGQHRIGGPGCLAMIQPRGGIIGITPENTPGHLWPHHKQD